MTTTQTSRTPTRCVLGITALRAVLGVAATAMVMACNRDNIDAPTDPRVTICHTQNGINTLQDVPLSTLASRRKEGDYVAQLNVDPQSTAGDSIHFRRLTDALAVARAGRLARNELETGSCRVTIMVAAGVLHGTTASSNDSTLEHFPLVIDVPDITVRGALNMELDEAGRATGSPGRDATTFAPSPPLTIVGGATAQTGSPEPIFVVNGHPDGSKGNGADIEGFVFSSGRVASDTTTIGGFGVLALRVRGIAVRGNRFEGGFVSAMDLRVSVGIAENNYMSFEGSSCDICLGGPGDYVVRGNRMIGGGIVGVLILPTVVLPVPAVVEQYVPSTSALVTALVNNNEIRDHLQYPVGVALRVGAVGIGAPDVAGLVRVTYWNNTLVNNTFGMIFEAAFVKDQTARRGDIDVTTSGNTFAQSCQNDVYVSTSSSKVGLGIQNGPSLLNSTYTLKFGSDISWDNAWFANAAGQGNIVMVNGQPVPTGSHRAFDALRVCGA